LGNPLGQYSPARSIGAAAADLVPLGGALD